MALAFFRKPPPQPAAAEAGGSTATPPVATSVASAMPGGDAAKDSAKDSAKDILNLLELELGAMIRQLERAVLDQSPALHIALRSPETEVVQRRPS